MLLTATAFILTALVSYNTLFGDDTSKAIEVTDYGVQQSSTSGPLGPLGGLTAEKFRNKYTTDHDDTTVTEDYTEDDVEALKEVVTVMRNDIGGLKVPNGRHNGAWKLRSAYTNYDSHRTAMITKYEASNPRVVQIMPTIARLKEITQQGVDPTWSESRRIQREQHNLRDFLEVITRAAHQDIARVSRQLDLPRWPMPSVDRLTDQSGLAEPRDAWLARNPGFLAENPGVGPFGIVLPDRIAAAEARWTESDAMQLTNPIDAMSYTNPMQSVAEITLLGGGVGAEFTDDR